VGNATARVHIWDIGGNILDMAKRIMDSCNIFLLCFSIVDEASFEQVKTLYQSIKHYRSESVFVCLVGCKGDLRNKDLNAIPESKIEDLASQIDVLYHETSAKENDRVLNVFNSGLIFAYKSYLAKQYKTIQDGQKDIEKRQNEQKELLNLIQNNVPLSDILSNARLRGLHQELYKSRNEQVIEHLATENSAKTLIENFLLDPSLNVESQTLFECSAIIFDYKVDPILCTIASSKEILEKLFTVFFNKDNFGTLSTPRKHLFVRLLMWLFESQYELMLSFAKNHQLIEQLMLNAHEESKLELLFLILSTEKKVLMNLKEENEEQVLLETIDFPALLFLMISSNTSSISVVDNLYKIVCKINGFTSPFVVNTLTYEQYKIPHFVLSLMEDPDSCSEAVLFLCDCLLPTYASNDSICAGFMQILSSRESLYASLIRSPSKILQHCGLRLVESFLKKKCECLVPPLLPYCLDLFFTHHRSNVFHNSISQIVTTTFQNSNPALLEIMINGNLLERIINAYEEREEPKEYYGHLAKMVKSIAECESPVVTQNELVKSDRWIKFTEMIMKEAKDTELLPPSKELRIQRQQKQIARGVSIGGMVIGGGASKMVPGGEGVM